MCRALVALDNLVALDLKLVIAKAGEDTEVHNRLIRHRVGESTTREWKRRKERFGIA